MAEGSGIKFTEEEIRQAVRERYGARARGEILPAGKTLLDREGRLSAEKIGYSAEELQWIPEEADTGLSCGNPLGYLELSEGAVVLDLGSGAGMDCFIASRAVGATGLAIGVDMTADMVKLARENAVKGGYENVCFLEGLIEELPLSDNTVDAVCSNCVLNLVPDKAKAFSEAYRVLKSGGCFCFSDVVITRPLSERMKSSLSALTACAAGAIALEEYLRLLTKAGFTNLEVKNTRDWPFYRGLVSAQIYGEKL